MSAEDAARVAMVDLPFARSRTRRSRALDWWCTHLVMAIGICLALPGDSLTGDGYERMLEVMPEGSWAALVLGVAWLRLIALVINGRAYEGSPIVRAFGAAAGAALWSIFAVVFLDISIRASVVSPGLGVFLVLSGADFHNAVRAGRDVIHARRARGRLVY